MKHMSDMLLWRSVVMVYHHGPEIELLLIVVGLGWAYIEVLVVNDPTKKVLHVQSISCWALAVLVHTVRQRCTMAYYTWQDNWGLVQATMVLYEGDPAAELEQAPENSEAVARSFNCSISTSATVFMIYCSASMEKSERIGVQNNIEALKQMKSHCAEGPQKSEVLDPVFLNVS